MNVEKARDRFSPARVRLRRDSNCPGITRLTVSLDTHLIRTARKVGRESKGDLSKRNITYRPNIFSKQQKALTITRDQKNFYNSRRFAMVEFQARGEERHSRIAIRSELHPLGDVRNTERISH